MVFECSVCFGSVEKPADESVLGSSLRLKATTRCGHIFHASCLDNWMARSRTCPQCTTKIGARGIHYLNGNTMDLDVNSCAETTCQKQKQELQQVKAELEAMRKKLAETEDVLEETKEKFRSLEIQEPIRISRWLKSQNILPVHDNSSVQIAGSPVNAHRRFTDWHRRPSASASSAAAPSVSTASSGQSQGQAPRSNILTILKNRGPPIYYGLSDSDDDKEPPAKIPNIQSP